MHSYKLLSVLQLIGFLVYTYFVLKGLCFEYGMLLYNFIRVIIDHRSEVDTELLPFCRIACFFFCNSGILNNVSSLKTP